MQNSILYSTQVKRILTQVEWRIQKESTEYEANFTYVYKVSDIIQGAS